MSTGHRLCDLPVYLSGAEVARRVGKHRNTILMAADTGTLPIAAWLGTIPLFNEESVQVYQSRTKKRHEDGDPCRRCKEPMRREEAKRASRYGQWMHDDCYRAYERDRSKTRSKRAGR